MQNKLYVGNLNYSLEEEELKELFEGYGEVQEVKIIEGKGFGFVTMGTDEEAEAAKALNDTELKGRNIRVSAARPPRERRPRNNYHGGGNRGGYGNRW